MAVIQTACTYDCPDACALRVTVEDGAAVRIQGDPDHPVTRGRVCYRVHRHLERLRHAERLTAPRRRTPDGWEELTWDAALELCAEELRLTLGRHGAPGVLHICGGGSLGLSRELVGHFFRSLGPVTGVRGGVCGEAGEAAQREDFGELACHDYTDLANSAAVVLWGKNPVASGVHLVPFVSDARGRGAPVWLVDPAPTETRRLAHRVLRVAPGGDGALALAVLRRLYERGQLDDASIARAEGFGAFEAMLRRLEPGALIARSGLSEGEIDALAALYGGTRPVATWIGWGLQRCLSGGHSVRCIDALCLLTGQVGVPGGGASFTSRRSRGLDRAGFAPGPGRTVAASTLGRELEALDGPPVGFVYICGANPVTQHADSDATRRALERPSRFVVVADAFLTDTARAADLVLPVTLMLEDGDDVVGAYQHHHVARVRRAATPPPGVRDDLWIVRELGRRIGRPDDPLLADPAATVARMSAAWFPDERPFGRNPTQPEVPFAAGFPTPSGKARLISEPPPPPDADERYPLTLLSLSSRRWQTSQLLEAEQRSPARCIVHPCAAAGLAHGARARLVSPLGELVVELALDAGLHPAACVVHRGGWVACGRGVNLLVEGRATDLGGGTAFYSQQVRLEPL